VAAAVTEPSDASAADGGSASASSAAARPSPIRVAVVDDHPVLREGTAALLAAQPGLEMAGVAGTVEEATTLVESTDVDSSCSTSGLAPTAACAG